jgi:hypothetical protein
MVQGIVILVKYWKRIDLVAIASLFHVDGIWLNGVLPQDAA